MFKLLRSYPFLSASTVQAILAFVMAAGWFHPTAGQTGAIEAAAAAVLALLVAPHVMPSIVPIAIGALTAIGAVLIAFKVPHISAAEVSAFVAVLSALLGVQGHSAVTSNALEAVRAARQRL
jgi:hypothetical protein